MPLRFAPAWTSTLVTSSIPGFNLGMVNTSFSDLTTPSAISRWNLTNHAFPPLLPDSLPVSLCITIALQCILLSLLFWHSPQGSDKTRADLFVFFATLAPHSSFVANDGAQHIDEPLRLHNAIIPSLMTESDNEAVVFFDGDQVCTVYKDSSQRSSKDTYKAYKRADQKVKPVPVVFPEDARIKRSLLQDLLETLPVLPIKPPDFSPDGRLTRERLAEININPDGFLWPEEEKLAIHVLHVHQDAFVFDDTQRGTFREDYFSPYVIPVVPHVPWAFSNISIPPGIREKVVELLREKISAGVYEPSQSSYQSRWFCVLKKSGKLRIVHDLQPLNKVTIQDAGLPPNLDSLVEPFARRQCYTVFDLHWGFDTRKVAVESRDLTAFLTPLGLLQITSLPTGFTNLPAEFQACMSFILKDEIPHIADVFIDDLPIKGPTSRYKDEDGNPEVMAENAEIRQFIWEHLTDVI